MKHLPIVFNLFLFIFISGRCDAAVAASKRIKLEESTVNKVDKEVASEATETNEAGQKPTLLNTFLKTSGSRKRRIHFNDKRKVQVIGSEKFFQADYLNENVIEYKFGAEVDPGKILFMDDEIFLLERITSTGIKVIGHSLNGLFLPLSYVLPLKSDSSVSDQSLEGIDGDVSLVSASENYYPTCYGGEGSFAMIQIMNEGSEDKFTSYMPKLRGYLRSGHLMSAGIMLLKVPTLIRKLTPSDFNDLIFYKNCHRKFFKQLIFDIAPMIFIKKFLDLYLQCNPKDQNLLLEDLRSVLCNWSLMAYDSQGNLVTTITDSVIQMRKLNEIKIIEGMVEIILGHNNTWPIIEVFVQSQRKFNIVEKSIFESLKTNLCNFRTLKSILKHFNTANFIEKTIKAISHSKLDGWKKLFRELLNDNYVISKLSKKFCVDLLVALTNTDIKNIKFILDLKIIDKVKNEEAFKTILDRAFAARNSDLVQSLLHARSPKTNFPLFNSKCIRKLAQEAFENGDNYVLLCLIDANLLGIFTSLGESFVLNEIIRTNNVEIARFLGPLPAKSRESLSNAVMTEELREAFELELPETTKSEESFRVETDLDSVTASPNFVGSLGIDESAVRLDKSLEQEK